MSTRRFSVENLTADLLRVTGDQAHHALRVLRLRPGAEVALFDGRGGEATGRILEIADEELIVEVLTRREVTLSRVGLTLAVATPKGERADWMIEKCAELGVRTLIPLICERGQVVPGEAKIDRWKRKAIEAAKQSGQAHALSMEPATTLAQAVGLRDENILYGDPNARRTLAATLQSFSMPCDTRILIGPEGGFTEAEVALIVAGSGMPVRLAAGTLRVETAAVAAASVWAQWALGLE